MEEKGAEEGEEGIGMDVVEDDEGSRRNDASFLIARSYSSFASSNRCTISKTLTANNILLLSKLDLSTLLSFLKETSSIVL